MSRGTGPAREVRLGHLLASVIQGTSPVCDHRPADEGEWGVLKLSAVDNGIFRPEQNKALVDSQPDKSASLASGDILITRSNTPELVGDACLVREDPGRLLVPDLIYRLRVRKRSFDPRYLTYVLTSRGARARLRARARGTSQSMVKIRGNDIRHLRIARPPLAEQKAVADFLDREMARVDELVSKKQLLADRLRTRRRALVDKVMRTARLSPVARIRHLAERITSGPRGWAGYVADNGEPFLRISNVQRGSIELALEDVVRVAVPPEARAEARRTRVSGGDILVSITADIGSVGLVPSSIREGYVSQHLCLICPRRDLVNPEWLAFALFSSDAQHQLDSARYGGTKTQLALDDVASVQIPLPPLDEQVELARRLREGHRRLTTLVDKLDDQMLVLQERRQALIAAAVTGELDVARVS